MMEEEKWYFEVTTPNKIMPQKKKKNTKQDKLMI
jgi:hypothetical protein